jgi:drug/metabolite transporter (DMT)-like permease
MLAAALAAGERLSARGWIGFVVAVAGLCWLVAPGVSAPSPAGAVLMTAAGVAWGVYSLLGRGRAEPLRMTAMNFIGSIPIVLAVSLLALQRFHASWQGLALATVSGAVTSGLGYVAWYGALRELAATRAATLQLSVPVIAGFGGVVLLAEPVTLRLLLASVATIGGVALVVAPRRR